MVRRPLLLEDGGRDDQTDARAGTLPARLSGWVGPGEQVAKRPAPPQGDPDPPPALGPVVQQVAPLAQGSNVAVLAAAMGRVMVEMRRRQHDLGR